MSETQENYTYSSSMAGSVPLVQRSGLETIQAVQGKLREAIAEMLASPDRRQWPAPMVFSHALDLEDDIDRLTRRFAELEEHFEFERDFSDGFKSD